MNTAQSPQVHPPEPPGSVVIRAPLIVWGLAVVFGLYYLTPLAVPEVRSDPQLILRLVLPAVLAVAALTLRHRLPVWTGLIILLGLVGSPAAIGAASAFTASIADRGRTRHAIGYALAAVAAKIAQLLTSGSPSFDVASRFELIIAITGLVVGLSIGAVWQSSAVATQERGRASAARADAEAARLERVRAGERERIAQEMHDVLAHRLSLVAMHAGVLAGQEDLSSEDSRQSAVLIRNSSKQALDELRLVLANLRGSDAAPAPPQPTLADLPVLLAESREAGQEVDSAIAPGAEEVTGQTGRSAFRIVQEALTNARRHAPGAPVHVRIDIADDILTLEVRNRLTPMAQANRGEGFGLIGISERARAAGGTSTVGSDGESFAVRAELPVGGRR